MSEAEIALLRSKIEAPLIGTGNLVEVARSYAAVADGLFPQVTGVIEVFHRHQLEAIGRRYSDVSAPTSSANVVELTVGFADIAGYTGLSHQLDPTELASMLARFEATTGDVIAAAGANVAKRIGDAVMFVTNAPGIACALALELIEACTREKLPKLRVGLAVGDVIVRQGDFYGRTVNLAARLVAEAEPGTALVDSELHQRLARSGPATASHPPAATTSPASTARPSSSNSCANAIQPLRWAGPRSGGRRPSRLGCRRSDRSRCAGPTPGATRPRGSTRSPRRRTGSPVARAR